MLRLIPVLGLLLVLVACTSTTDEPAASSDTTPSPVSDRPVFPGTRTPIPTATATPALEALTLPASTEQPIGLIAFAAGGSIYTVNADGSGLRQVVAGDRDGVETTQGRPNWLSSPAISPDGSRIAFVKDFSAWVADVDGANRYLLAEVADLAPPACLTCSSTWSLGASNLAWSPDGAQILYVLNRTGGSGAAAAGVIDVASGTFSEFPRSSVYSVGFIYGLWLHDGTMKLSTGSELVELDSAKEAHPGTRLVKGSRPDTINEALAGTWITGSWVSGQPILVQASDELAARPLAMGVSPALSPTHDWIAYFKDESLRLVRTDGRDDHELVDLTPLGGRDRHFASQPDCFPGNAPACSYRPPLISWTGAR